MKYNIGVIILTFLLSSCGDGNTNNSIPVTSQYGKAGSHIPAEPYKGINSVDYVTYYPKDIKADKSTPVIFFAPGGFSTGIENHSDYSTILNFIASHGYLVIYVPTNPDKLTDTQHYLSEFIKSAEEDITMKPYIDTTRIGVMGWSSGGGNAFSILKGLSDKGWGENGRFLFLMDPWFAFDMNKIDISNLPDNTNVIFQKYNKIQETDPRITLTTYKLLTSINNRKKDYQIYTDVGHNYVEHSGDYSELQYILKPLDALMEYTFIEESEGAYNTALNIGNDAPYETGKEIPESKDSYRYSCHTYNNWSNHVTDINYCEITD